MDGSRRLTVWNRRFVRRIITSPDLAGVEIPSRVIAETKNDENNDNDDLASKQDITFTANQQQIDDQVETEGERVSVSVRLDSLSLPNL